MLGANKSTGLAMTVALLLSQTIAFADESSSTTIKSNSPLGSASTSVQVNSDAVKTSKDVSSESANAAQSKSSQYHAEVGLDGAKVESKKQAVGVNADGSVTSSNQSESHAVNAAGSAHHKASASTTVAPDGSNTTIKQEQSSVHP